MLRLQPIHLERSVTKIFLREPLESKSFVLFKDKCLKRECQSSIKTAKVTNAADEVGEEDVENVRNKGLLTTACLNMLQTILICKWAP